MMKKKTAVDVYIYSQMKLITNIYLVRLRHFTKSKNLQLSKCRMLIQ